MLWIREELIKVWKVGYFYRLGLCKVGKTIYGAVKENLVLCACCLPIMTEC